ncbi:MAG TPA: uroporphyrinogen-III C-methyltransferase [Cellvibrionaceae bacterium]
MADHQSNEHKPDDPSSEPTVPAPVEAPAASDETPTPPVSTPATRGKKRWWMPALLLLLGVGIGAGALWFVSQQTLGNISQRLGELEQQPVAAGFDDAALKRELASVQSTQATQASSLQALEAIDHRATAQALTNLARQFAELEQRVDALGSASGQHWRLAEAEFLLRLAHQRTLLGNTGAETLALTEAANAILRQQDEPALFAVRQALATEIAGLKQAAPIDREGVYLQLQAILEQLGQLDLARSYERVSGTDDNQSVAQADGVWATAKASVKRAWGVLSGYIRVRHHDQPVEPLLAPEQGYFLRQNLHLMLEQAQLAVLHAEPLVYQQSLDKAISWLDTYFANSHSQTLMDELSALKTIQVQMDVPASGEALNLLRAYLAREQGGES